MTRRLRASAAFVLGVAVSTLPDRARANGAFPDSLSIFAPAGLPDTIVLGTNFGLLISEDGGTSWTWVCEAGIAPLPSLYQVGPAPDHKLYAVSWTALASSSDLGCSWHYAGGALENKETIDSFPHPIDPVHVLALSRSKETATAAFALHRSSDGARTFEEVAPAQPEGARLQSVEIAVPDLDRVYMTSWKDLPPHPYVLRSENGGGEFEVIDGEPSFGRHVSLIAAVDPEDEDTIYFRVLNTSPVGDSLAISRDGGRTARIALETPLRMSAFMRRSDGALIVGTSGNSGGKAYISSDGGETFSEWSTLSILGLAERDGAVYAAISNFRDGAMAAVTHDDGATWRMLGRYEDILQEDNIRACNGLTNRCLIELADLRLVLETPPAPPVPDAGVAPPLPPTVEDKCDCTSANETTTADPALLFTLTCLVFLRKNFAPRD